MKAEKTIINNRLVAYTDKGSGPAILLIHGFLESQQIWSDFSQTLSNTFRVITIDLPGHGATHHFDEILSMENMAGLIRNLLKILNIKNIIIIGHSMGGYVALQFTAKYKEMVRGLGLFHSHASADDPTAIMNRNRAIEFVKMNRTAFTIQFIPDLFAPENRAKHKTDIETLKNRATTITANTIIAALEGMKIRKPHHAILKQLESPVMFIIGEKDSRIVIPEIMQQTVLPAESHILFLKECGHMGYLEAKKATLSFITSFAKRCTIK
jgi:pimeloyl-ACP methyl ester carboxylesterase